MSLLFYNQKWTLRNVYPAADVKPKYFGHRQDSTDKFNYILNLVAGTFPLKKTPCRSPEFNLAM